MQRLLFILALALALNLGRAPAFGQAPDDYYVRIYDLIQQADTLNETGQGRASLAKYLEAQTELKKLQAQNPEWNRAVVSFRLNYLAGKIAALEKLLPAPPAPAPAAVPAGATNLPPTAPARSVEFQDQIQALQAQLRQVNSEKLVLEAKLKEALSVQPPTVDPRELAKAEQLVRQLQKERDLLQVTLEQQQTKAAAMVEAAALERTQKALAEAHLKITDQTKLAANLILERDALKKQVQQEQAKSARAADPVLLQKTQKALAETNRRLEQQIEMVMGLTREKETLQKKLKAKGPEKTAVAALEAENAALKLQVSELKQQAAAPAAAPAAAGLPQQLALAQTELARLRSQNEVLQKEKAVLEKARADAVARQNEVASGTERQRAKDLERLQQLERELVKARNDAQSGEAKRAALQAETAALETRLAAVASERDRAVTQRERDQQRLKDLEQERNELQKQLNQTAKELYQVKSKSLAIKVEELNSQLTALRARLEAYEARQVPYTAEELALFKKPDASLAALDPKAAKKAVKKLPPAAGKLVAEAQTEAASGRFQEAEQKFQEVLKQDQKHVYTLVNLAGVQIEQNRLAEAEQTLGQALAVDRDDAGALYLLGVVKFQQDHLDAAVELLSRAAKSNPNNADTHNYLGYVLGKKGMRPAAEAALRKAIQLQPGFGLAHLNLAVVYATQTPPFLELARWHYQKALASGLGRDPELEKKLDSAKAAPEKP